MGLGRSLNNPSLHDKDAELWDSLLPRRGCLLPGSAATGDHILDSSTSVRCFLHSKAAMCCRHLPKSLVKGEGLTDAPLVPTAIPTGTHSGRCTGGREHLALLTGCTGTCSSPKRPHLVPKIGCTPPCPQGSYTGSLLLLCSPWPCLLASRGGTGANSPASPPAYPAQCLAPSWWPRLAARGCRGSHCHSASAQGRR